MDQTEKVPDSVETVIGFLCQKDELNASRGCKLDEQLEQNRDR